MPSVGGSVRAEQRFKTADNPCPVCAGYEQMRRGQGTRCSGFMSSDGKYVHCTRDQFAGGIPLTSSSATYAHRATGDCLCGTVHGQAREYRASAKQHVRPAPKRAAPERKPEEVETYDYTDASGNTLYQVVRLRDPVTGKKSFRQRRKVDGEWVYKLDGVPRVPYQLPELIAAVSAQDSVWIVEGEKDADAIRARQLVATTNSGGAGKWDDSHATYLRGASDVRVVMDRDEPGAKHAAQVVESLRQVGATVTTWRAAEGNDIGDHFGHGLDIEDLVQADPVAELRRTQLPRSQAQGMGEVTMRPVDWVWKDYIPAAKVTLLDGDPNQGKTAICLELAARITSGRALPDGSPCPAADVLYVSMDDDAGDTIAPRFVAAGGRRDRMWLGAVVTDHTGQQSSINIVDHLDHIEADMVEHSVRVVFLDHIMGLMGKDADSNSGPPVAHHMLRLKMLAERTGAAVVVLRHLGKVSKGPAWTRGSGSGQFGAVIRSGLIVDRPEPTEDDSDPSRVLASYKNSCGETPATLIYDLEQTWLDDEKTGAQLDTVRVVWSGVSALTADDLTRSGASGTPSEAVSAAVEFLKAQLADHRTEDDALPSRELLEAGKRITPPISRPTMYRARDLAGVKSTGRKGYQGGSGWYLPAKGGPTLA